MERNQRVVQIDNSRARELSEAEIADAVALRGAIDEHGFYAARRLEDGRWLAVEPQTFGRARLGISENVGEDLRGAFILGYADVFDYDTREGAIAAMEAWNGVGEPEAWRRHFRTGRRRRDDGILVRLTDLDPGLLEELRGAVARGAGHECEEWEGEKGGQRTAVCVLCDQPIVREPIEIAARELSPAEAIERLGVFRKALHDSGIERQK